MRRALLAFIWLPLLIDEATALKNFKKCVCSQYCQCLPKMKEFLRDGQITCYKRFDVSEPPDIRVASRLSAPEEDCNKKHHQCGKQCSNPLARMKPTKLPPPRNRTYAHVRDIKTPLEFDKCMEPYYKSKVVTNCEKLLGLCTPHDDAFEQFTECIIQYHRKRK
jgi:hypothetical protein